MAKKKASPKPVKRAAPKKKAPPAAGRRVAAPPNLSLVGTPGVAAVAANVDVTFTSGVGQLTSSLFRHGMMINMQSISSSGTIFLSDVQTHDVISINGVCTGNASIRVSVPTSPATPQNFTAGTIHLGLIIL